MVQIWTAPPKSRSSAGARGEAAEGDAYHPDVQIHAPYLLLAQRPHDAQLTRRVKKMYEQSGYDLGLHM